MVCVQNLSNGKVPTEMRNANSCLIFFCLRFFLAEIFRNEKHLHVRMNDDGYTVSIVAEMTLPIGYVIVSAIPIEFQFEADDVWRCVCPSSSPPTALTCTSRCKNKRCFCGLRAIFRSAMWLAADAFCYCYSTSSFCLRHSSMDSHFDSCVYLFSGILPNKLLILFTKNAEKKSQLPRLLHTNLSWFFLRSSFVGMIHLGVQFSRKNSREEEINHLFSVSYPCPAARIRVNEYWKSKQ